MLLKESKIKVLENFYALDYIFFGKPVSEISTCCPLVKEEYLSIKGALMSVFVEMLRLVEHAPTEDSNRVTSRELMAEAKAAAQLSRNEAERVVSSPRSREDIKTSVRESMAGARGVDISTIVESKIREKAFSLAVDHLLIGGIVTESAALEDLNTWQGEIIEDSYKILRDNLVEAAHDIIYNDDLLTEEEEDKENPEHEAGESDKEEEYERKTGKEDEEETKESTLFNSLKQRLLEDENEDEDEDEDEDEEEDAEEEEAEENTRFFNSLKQRIVEDSKKK